MTTNHALDEEIRAYVLELVDSAPLPPQLQLEGDRKNPFPRWNPPRRSILFVGGVIAAAVIVVAALLVVPGSSQEVSEAQLGLRLASSVITTQPVSPGNVPVASGTFFGHPWLVSGVNPSSGRLCVGFSYRGSVLFGVCGRTGHLIPHPPAWARSAFASSLGTASDGQRYLVAATNSTVTELTVRAKGGTYVRTAALPEHLGNASFFVLSLGREHGACSELCQGSVTLSLSTSSGPTLIDNDRTLMIHDNEGEVAALNAPARR